MLIGIVMPFGLISDENRDLDFFSSPDINPSNFWMFGYFKGKLKVRDLQGAEKLFMAFQESGIT
jgi:hypothetical protein